MNSLPNRRLKQIGLDRIIRLEWLERTAYLFLEGNKITTIKQILMEDLRGAFRSNNTKPRNSLDKTVTILTKIWVNPPDNLIEFHRQGLTLLSTLPQEEHIAIHWGMTMAVYPFWGTVASHVGRLLNLQGTVSVNQIQRRVREQYGERATVSRAAQRVLRSIVNWKVLKETSEKGVYIIGKSFDINRIELIAWLIEAYLHAHPNGASTLQAILKAPNLFPFHLSYISTNQLASVSERLEVLTHGLDQDLIVLRLINPPSAKRNKSCGL